MCRAILVAVGVFVLTTSHLFAADTTAPISLSGQWSLRLDRDDQGVQQRFFAADLPEKINLPGSLQAAGFGDEVSVDTKWTGQIVDRSWYADPQYEKYRQKGSAKVPFWLTPIKHYVAPAWYQRKIEVPQDWAGKRVVLFLERPHWETRVWLDDKEIGTQNSLSVPHEYDLGDVKPGEHRLTIRVDNRVKIDVGINAHSVSDHTQTNWNGIVGKIELRATDPVWVDDVQVFPDVPAMKAKVRIAFGSKNGARAKGMLSLEAKAQNGAKLSFAPHLLQFAADANNSIEVSLPMDGADLWSEFNPAMYRLIVDFTSKDGDKAVSDHRELDFAMRQIGVEGTQFTVNGQRIFLRGTLECCIFPKTGYPPTDVESWLRILRIARAHGLNHLRFHSWCPPEAAFIAADRMGFFYQVEGGVWTTVGEKPDVDAFIRDEADRIFKAYGNHPSFCFYVHGNEPGGKNQNRFLGDLITSFKQKDTRRLYSAGSGWPIISENDYHCVPEPRVYRWGEQLKCRLNANPPETTTDYSAFIARHKVPVVSHEIGQWCVYPNLEEIAKYNGVTRAGNFEIFRDTLAANHMLDQAKDFLIASGKLQTLCYKEDIESALRTPGMAGFQLLDLHDFPGQGTALVGVLDPFWEQKGYVTPEEYRRFSGETVPLARLQKRIFTSDETLRARINIAHFGAAPIKDAVAVWSLATADGKMIASGQFAAQTIPIGNGTVLGQIETPLSDAPAPTKLMLKVEVKGTSAANDWDIWVYPPKVDAEAGDVLIVDRFDDATKAALKAGRKVMLVLAPGGVKGDKNGEVQIGFTSIFWNTAWTRKQAPHTLGILCDPKHPALGSFPTEFHSNWQWWELISRSQTMILNGMPAQLRPVVQVIDDWHTNRRLGLVFEARVGEGRLLVCGIDLKSDLESRPVARQMRSSLLKYMKGEAFVPKLAVEERQISELLSEPPVMQRLGAKVIKTDSEERGYEAAQAIDGDVKTIWHTEWEGRQPDYPHEIQVDLGRPVTLRGFKYTPRQDVRNGWASQYAFYVSDDGKQWGDALARGAFAKNADEKRVEFGRAITGRHIRFVAEKGFDGQKFATMAELDLILAGEGR